MSHAAYYALVLDAVAALYGKAIWEMYEMQELAHELETAAPTLAELDYIIEKHALPARLADIKFTAVCF